MVFKSIPHKNPPQIRMTGEYDSKEIENLALLKLSGAPYGRERWQLDLIRPVDRAHTQDHRSCDFPVCMLHRKQVIDRFQLARFDALDGLFHDRLDALDDFG